MDHHNNHMSCFSGWFPTPWRRVTCSTLTPAAPSAPTVSCCPPTTTSRCTPRRSCPSSFSSPPVSAPSRHSWHYWPTLTPRPCPRLASSSWRSCWWCPSFCWKRPTDTYHHLFFKCCPRFKIACVLLQIENDQLMNDMMMFVVLYTSFLLTNTHIF